MKKLTAGIFATILGVTAMGAADAAVTSKGYVDAALATKASASEVSELSTTVSGHTAQINTLNTTAANHATKAEVEAVQTNVNKLAGTVGTIPSTATATTVVGYVDEMTKDIASSDTVSNLATRVKTIEDDYITATELSTSQSEQNTAITAAYEADDAATLKAAQDYADAAESAAIAAAALDATKYIDADELAASQDAQNTTIAETYVNKTSYVTDKTALDQSIAGVKATADAAATQTALQEEATARAEADAELQEAIEAVEGGVEDITGATDGTTNGKYALTKIVTDNGDGTTSVSYGWELIERDYVETDVTDDGE